MIFHENRLLADDSHLISYLFCRKLGKMSQNLSYAAIVIGALRVNNKIEKTLQQISNSCMMGRPQGGTLIFSSCLGSSPASTVHPPPPGKKYQEF